jgi:hypothetical protein
MKLYRLFGLLRHRAHYAQMRATIRSGDTIRYIDRGLYGDRRDIRTTTVGCVAPNAEWVFTKSDDAVRWAHILDWTPQDHVPECNPTNCDISGEEWEVRQFVHRVRTTNQQGEICILFSSASSAFADPQKIWPAMERESFRNAVMQILPLGRFYPPDDLSDDWQFAHYPNRSQIFC